MSALESAAPLVTHEGVVKPEWIDLNGHLNIAYYVLLFDNATDGFLEHAGYTAAFRDAHNASTFVAEMHVNYLSELKEGDRVRLTTQLLGFDAKRIQFFNRMHDAGSGKLAATNEMMCLNIDMGLRKVVPMQAEIRRSLERMRRDHANLPWPEQAGRSIRVPPA